jgi:hypothetical protein
MYQKERGENNMPTYKAYGKKVDTKSRMTRKQSRRTTFLFNKNASKIVRKQRKAARDAAREAAEAVEYEETVEE